MAFTDAAGAELVRERGGVTYRFRFPTRDQIGRQIAAWAAEDRTRLLRVLEDAKAPPDLRVAVLQEHETRSRLYSYGLRCAFEFARSGDIVKAACGIDPADLPFTHDEVVDLAAELWGMPVQPLQAVEDTKKKPADPELTPGTGGSPMPSSGTGTDASPGS